MDLHHQCHPVSGKPIFFIIGFFKFIKLIKFLVFLPFSFRRRLSSFCLWRLKLYDHIQRGCATQFFVNDFQALINFGVIFKVIYKAVFNNESGNTNGIHNQDEATHAEYQGAACFRKPGQGRCKGETPCIFGLRRFFAQQHQPGRKEQKCYDQRNRDTGTHHPAKGSDGQDIAQQ